MVGRGGLILVNYAFLNIGERNAESGRTRPGVGLNDMTPVAPVGGNPGTTLGEQRRITYQYAMDLWGALLKSDVDIRVQASFVPLECRAEDWATYIMLGLATELSNVPGNQIPGAKIAEAQHPIALANSLAGKDLNEGEDDIFTAFSSSVDEPECRAIGASGWHYGLRGNADNIGGKANFLNVIMHEIGHGLGVSSDATPGIGGPWGYNTRSNQFDKALPAIESDADMTKALTTPGDVVWTGALSVSAVRSQCVPNRGSCSATNTAWPAAFSPWEG